MLGDSRLPDRYWSKVRLSGECWIWIGGTMQGGYGVFHHGEHNVSAHRLSYKTLVGEIPDGILVLHSCDNPPCVNPKHLFLGTDKDNYVDMVKKGRERGICAENKTKTHCKNGHKFEGENLSVLKNGERRCRRCCNENARRYRLAHRKKKAS